MVLECLPYLLAKTLVGTKKARGPLRLKDFALFIDARARLCYNEPMMKEDLGLWFL